MRDFTQIGLRTFIKGYKPNYIIAYTIKPYNSATLQLFATWYLVARKNFQPVSLIRTIYTHPCMLLNENESLDFREQVFSNTYI